jgi:nitrogen regulatory protein PII-like uncharacterized protein
MINSDKCEGIMKQIEEALEGISYTIIVHEVVSIKVKRD